MRIAHLVLALITLVAPFEARGQGTVTVPVDDPLYRDVDRLIDAGLATHVVVGQRPYSRRMIARLVREARLNLDTTRADAGSGPSLEAISVNRLRAAFAPEVADLDGDARAAAEVRWTPIRSLRAEALVTDAPTRSVPSNGLGSVEADVNPLIDGREGRPFVPGGNVALESEHAIQFLAGISLQAQPRFWAYRGRSGRSAGIEGALLSANLRAVRGKVALTVGREYTEWSPAPGAGLLFSENAPALDMVRVATDAPIVLPSVLGWLGGVSGTLQIADMGRSDSSDHSRLVSYKVSISPTNTLELGGTFVNHYGGAGARPVSALDRFIDLVPFLDIFRHHVDSTAVDSDKLLGVDGRLRISQLGNIALFGELALEDFDFHRLGSIFTEDAAYTAGVIIPTFLTPALSARVGYHVVGLRFYEHHILRNGIAVRRFTLGDDLGHDASGFFGLLRSEHMNGISVTAEGAYESRRNDEYVGAYTKPGLTGLVFSRVTARPEEQRSRGTVSVRWFRPDGGMMVELKAGVERVGNFAFVAAPDRTHGLASVSAAWYH